MCPRLFVPFAIFLTMLTSMGESLHALPGMEHESSEVCHVSTTHVDSTPDDSGTDCDLCHFLNQVHVVRPDQVSIQSGQQFQSIVIGFFLRYSYPILSTHTTRGPPLV
jgi:hypothetical protein